MCWKRGITTCCDKSGRSYLFIDSATKHFSLKIKKYVGNIKPQFEIINNILT